MRDSQAPARIVDVSDVRFRVGTIRIGVWVTLAVCSVGIAYAVATWNHAHRSLVVVLLAVAWVSACVVGLTDAEKVVRSRWREAFFFLWSGLDIAIVGVLEASDGGARSPTVLIFVLPLAFAALSYPLPSVVAIALLDVTTYILVSAAVDPPGFTYIAFVAASLACAAALCVAQARNHHAQRAELARVSRTDSLTDSLNRRGFEERLDGELAEARRAGSPLALMLLDLDNFKFVNDTQGHAAGDELLCWMVTTVRATLRPVDALGRLGGDEFAVVLPGAARAEALEVVERVERALAARVQATIGVATFPADGTDREELHRHADAELYGAKHDRAGAREGTPRPMTAPVSHSGAVAAYAWGIAERLGFERDELSLRILAVADAFHAMTSHRPYRRALTRERALAELRASHQFDRSCVDALEAHLGGAVAPRRIA
ncbi:MAG: diguanylate cyclase [Thermoleophilaceae bacterium]